MTFNLLKTLPVKMMSKKSANGCKFHVHIEEEQKINITCCFFITHFKLGTEKVQDRVRYTAMKSLNSSLFIFLHFTS